MVFNENLADQVREALIDQRKIEEKKMMDSLNFMVNGKMCVGIPKNNLTARIDPELH